MARILVVDDDQDILKLSKAVLGHEKHVVLTASDAIQAMDILNTQLVDLLISDANMPHYSGFDLVQTIKKEAHLAELPIAMLTGLRERKDIEKAIRLGVDDYIVKPIDPMILIQKIDNMLSKNPPKEMPKIEFSSHPHSIVSKVSLDVTLVSISEINLCLTSSIEFTIGQIVDIQSDFFHELGEAPPPMKVQDILEKDGQRIVRLNYLGAKESFLQKIRKWIFTHSQTKRAA